MQHIAIRLAVAFLTFCVGLAASALWGFFSLKSEQCTVSTRPTLVRAEAPVAVKLAPGKEVVQVISGGLLNGKAISKPAPVYPAIAKAARAEGTVAVQLRLDKNGNVEEAVAVSGHPLLRSAAVDAVRQWRFTPTLLNGQPVKVTGVANVNFILD